LSLVDPDNRRPVDFAGRRALLEAVMLIVEAAEAGRPVADRVTSLAAAWPDGRIKLLVTACTLRFGRAHADFMARADYLPLEVEGPAAEHVVAFARRRADAALIVVAPRLVTGRLAPHGLALARGAMAGTRVRLPPAMAGASFRHLVTSERIAPSDDAALDADALLRPLPVAIGFCATCMPTQTTE
jgi:(1->4)-alpha-D-glucan 1-alpha-D-glucosylmutase